MTNKIATILGKIFRTFFIFFLLLIAFLLFGTFAKFSAIEKRLASEHIDYSKILDINYNSATSTKEQSKTSATDTRSQLIMGNGSNYSLGPKQAKITIVEFADFACPYCRKSFPIIRELSLKYSHDIKYIFRDLPIIKTYSANLALGVRCAGEQNLFWPMHDKLFSQKNIDTDEKLYKLAQQSGVSMDKFKNCYQNKKYLPQIKKDVNDAQALQIDKIGTPIWFINGYQIAGNIPEKTFNKIINDILNK